tara:strand:+ start:258 stop:1817 length:1560 start_codon:yes stop_codon:yes gene_type:complete
MDTSRDNVIKLVQPKKAVTFTKPFIKNLLKKRAVNGTRYTDTKHSGFKIKARTHDYVFLTESRLKDGSNKQVTITIGSVQDIPLAGAIKAHQDNYSKLQQGINPNAEKKKEVFKEASFMPVINDYAKTKSRAKTWSEKTIELNDGLIKNHINRIVGNKPLSEIRDKEWVEWYFSMKTSVAKNALKLISASYNSMSKKEQAENENPKKIVARKIGGIPSDNTRINRSLDTDVDNNNLGEWLSALDIYFNGWAPDDEYIIPPSTKDRTLSDLMLFIVLTGVRLEACLELTWDDVDFDNYLINLREKGRHGRKNLTSRPMTDYLVIMLRRRLDEAPKGVDLVFNTIQETMDKACQRVALIMETMFSTQPPRHITRILNNKPISRDGWSKLLEETIRNEEFRKKLNAVGTKPHDLRRTLQNVAGVLNFNDSVLDSMLDHSSGDVKGKHYLTIQRTQMEEAFLKAQRYMDNRIAEYVGVTEKGNKFYSPIFNYLGANKVLVNKDDYYQSAKGLFPEKKKRKIGD